MTLRGDLLADDIALRGRIIPASNATFVGDIGEVHVVYKPVAGEKPLWDFPTGSLAHREVAAFAVSEATGWNIVPRTWLRDGPHGPGMVQCWEEPIDDHGAVTLVPSDEIPRTGWHRVLDGLDASDNEVSLVHEDTAALRHMALFDIVVNNADRKGGHVLTATGGHRFGVDHGLTFHAEPKLRTVLWGWTGESLTHEERAVLTRLLDDLRADLGRRLAAWLTDAEIAATIHRCEALLRTGEFPAPEHDSPVVPWPLF